MIEFKNCEGVVFDLDGTLVDSMWVWEDIDNEFLGKRGIPVPDNYVDIITPMGFEECADYTIKRFGLKESNAEVMNEWHNMAVYSYANKVKLKPGVEDFLKYLRENNVKMSIATANSLELVIPALKNNMIDGYFDNITTLKEVSRGKEFPDVYDLSTSRLGADKNKCVVFEDIIEGIRAAKLGGYKVIGVFDKRAEDKVELLSSNADYFIYDYKECMA